MRIMTKNFIFLLIKRQINRKGKARQGNMGNKINIYLKIKRKLQSAKINT